MRKPPRTIGAVKCCSYTALLFFHPDFTVGIGISPIRGDIISFADYTAGEEFHLAPKNICLFIYYTIQCFLSTLIELFSPRAVHLDSEKLFAVCT